VSLDGGRSEVRSGPPSVGGPTVDGDMAARVLTTVGALGRRLDDGGGRPRPPTLVTLRVEPAATRRHLLADCWQTTLRAEGGDAKCLVELRGFEPLTPCADHPNTSNARV
jgi:hypothetical protein